MPLLLRRSRLPGKYVYIFEIDLTAEPLNKKKTKIIIYNLSYD